MCVCVACQRRVRFSICTHMKNLRSCLIACLHNPRKDDARWMKHYSISLADVNVNIVFIWKILIPLRETKQDRHMGKRGGRIESERKNKREQMDDALIPLWHPLILLSHHSIHRGKAESVVLPLSTIHFSIPRSPTFLPTQRLKGYI